MAEKKPKIVKQVKVKYEGYLWKLGDRRKNHKERLFRVTDDGMMRYYHCKKSQKEEMKGEFKVANYTTQFGGNMPTRIQKFTVYPFVFKPRDGEGRIYHVAATIQEYRRKWAKVIASWDPKAIEIYDAINSKKRVYLAAIKAGNCKAFGLTERDFCDLDNNTFFHYAARTMQGGFDQALLEHFVQLGIDFNKYNDYGETPLILLAKYGHDRAVELLVGAGADLQAKRQEGGKDAESVLHEAARSGNLNLIKFLLNHNADVCYTFDWKGRPISTWMERSGEVVANEDIATILLEKANNLELRGSFPTFG
eukprot:TRINITY_DN22331_c0_g1_i1.p1 TRINITY_DN22331_c0_g1~~TRINITY_DN22331_c0_g1_i1.p1  ORF type:complete len:332 (-),score=64.53 TRINITY_DN22331_c0_g1_i1:39-962(-)